METANSANTNPNTAKVRAEVLKALLNGAPVQGSHYGAPCGCAERANAAGTSLSALRGVGLVLQCEHHHGYMGTHRVPEGVKALEQSDPVRQNDLTARRLAYKNAHHAQIDARVTENTCPSGLRLAVIPSGWKAAEVTEWYRQLVARANGPTDEHGLVLMPDVSIRPIPTGDGAPLSAESRSPGTGSNINPGSVQGPKAYRSTVFQFAAIAAAIERIVGNAKEADDEARAKEAIEAITAWGWASPVQLFDPGLWDGKIRVGAKITLVGESAHIRAKTMGGALLTDGGGYDVSFSDDTGIKVLIPGRKLPLFLKSGEFVRWVSKPVVTAATGPKFAAGDVVTHSAFGEGEILAVETANNITMAKVFFIENDLGEVDGIELADLTKIG